MPNLLALKMPLRPLEGIINLMAGRSIHRDPPNENMKTSR
jgi:hypothetical protein